jgi:hypothetical protein
MSEDYSNELSTDYSTLQKIIEDPTYRKELDIQTKVPNSNGYDGVILVCEDGTYINKVKDMKTGNIYSLTIPTLNDPYYITIDNLEKLINNKRLKGYTRELRGSTIKGGSRHSIKQRTHKQRTHKQRTHKQRTHKRNATRRRM